MNTVRVTVTDKVRVTSPYNADFLAGANGIGGKWIGGKWEFSLRHEARARELCVEVYGTDGTHTETVTVICNLDFIAFGSEFNLGATQVLKKWERDRTPKVGEGCAVIAGKLRSRGGSRNHPTIEHDSGTVMEVENVPLVLARQLVKDNPEAYQIADDGNALPDLTNAELALVDALGTLSADRMTLVLAEVRSNA